MYHNDNSALRARVIRENAELIHQFEQLSPEKQLRILIRMALEARAAKAEMVETAKFFAAGQYIETNTIDVRYLRHSTN